MDAPLIDLHKIAVSWLRLPALRADKNAGGWTGGTRWVRGAQSADMKVDTRYNSRNYAGAYYAPAILGKKTGNASAPPARLRKVARKEGRGRSYEPSDVNAIRGNRLRPTLLLSLFLKPQSLRPI